MRTNKQKYTYSWIALGFMILSASFLLILSISRFNINNLQFYISVLLWIAILAPGIYLFLSATDRILKNSSDTSESSTDLKQKIKQQPTASKNDSEHIDIQAIAKKIVRRTNPDNDPEKWSLQLLKQFVAEIEIMSGIFYLKNDKNIFEPKSTYAFPQSKEPYSFEEGEGLTGQVAKNRQVSVYRSIPENYKEVFSGLGSGKPSYLAIIPIQINEKTVAVIEVAGFKWSDEKLEQLFQIVAKELAEKMLAINNE